MAADLELGFHGEGMESVSSKDTSNDRSGSYSSSADVSSSETSSDFSGCCFAASASSSLASSSPPQATSAVTEIITDDLVLWQGKLEKHQHFDISVEMMKERFAKLLLGEDMSCDGKGICTALAITNLSAMVFGELWRLEPLAAQKKVMWRREMECLLCVSDSIVEFTPSLQDFPNRGTFEVMVSRPCSDLYMNLPTLKKLDAMLLGMLEGFRETEF